MRSGLVFALIILACGKPAAPPPPPLGPETCDNGKDDNGDQKVDCADPKCFSAAVCSAATAGGDEATAGGGTAGGGTAGGGTAGGNATAGGATAGGATAGGATAGGATAGGATAGGATAGGATAGGATAGGATAGGATAGGATAGGATAGGATAGGATAGGAAVENCTDGLDNDNDRAIDCGDTSCTGNGACSAQPDGRPCLFNNQCAGGLCDTQAATGAPNGMCTNAVNCNAANQTGCNGGLCVALGTVSRCFQRCTGTGLGATGRCRTGYACRDADTTPNNGDNYCQVLCVVDIDCVGADGGGYGCNYWSTRCGPKNLNLAKYGAPCTASSQCETGLCATGSFYPGGYCVGFCRGDIPVCATDGDCAYFSTYGDNVGGCFDRCTAPPILNNPQCRAGYQCRTRAGATYCTCGTAGEVCAVGGDCCSGTCSGTTCM